MNAFARAVSIRSATLDDIPTILAMERQAPSAAHWTADQYATLVVNGVFLVAQEAGPIDTGQVYGFVCAKAIAGECEIENMVVSSSSLRRGIADRLLGFLIERAKHEAASAIRLEVRKSNLPARKLYQKHGFCESGCRRGYYVDPEEDAVLYKLSL